MSAVPAAVTFAARYWGGEGVVPVERPAVTHGRRDVDGGRQRIPPGWTFRADGFTYHVYADRRRPGVWHWTDGSPWGSSCRFTERADHWLVEGHEVRRVPK